MRGILTNRDSELDGLKGGIVTCGGEMVVRAPRESVISERLDAMMKTQGVSEPVAAMGFQCDYAFDRDEEWQREWNGVNGAEEGVGDVAIFNDSSGNKATSDDSDPTFIYDGDTGVAQVTPSILVTNRGRCVSGVREAGVSHRRVGQR